MAASICSDVMPNAFCIWNFVDIWFVARSWRNRENTPGNGFCAFLMATDVSDQVCLHLYGMLFILNFPEKIRQADPGA